jgi:hypothetical protein
MLICILALFLENGIAICHAAGNSNQQAIVPSVFLLSLASSPQPAETTVTASSFENDGQQYHPPAHAFDNDFTTRWSSLGSGEWIQFRFPTVVTLDAISIAFHNGDQRISFFTVSISANGSDWSEIFSGRSSGSTTALETFPLNQTTTRYLRITGGGNSDNEWNSYVEVYFPPANNSTCSDNTRNQDETGIDCGGVCGGNCCSNGYQDINLNETGVDCGGSCSPCTSGITYYISSSGGDDENSGLSPEQAWKSIDRVNDSSLHPGDTVLFKRGEIWREQLQITWSGTVENPITFAAYGSGSKPKIYGSERALNWIPVAGHANIWESTTTLDVPRAGHPASIFFGEQDGEVNWGRVQSYSAVNNCGNAFSLLQQEYDWCWDNAIYVYSPDNPTGRYSFIEVPQRRGSITMLSHQPMEYIVIDGLDLRYGTMYGYNDGWPMDYEVRGLTIRECHISHIGIRGGNSAMGLVVWHSDLLVSGNDIHDCGRRSISYNVYTDNGREHDNLVFENVVFENNTLHNGYHTTGFDISHGDVQFDTFRDFTFRNNFIYDDPADNPADGVNDFTSMALYLWPGNGVFRDFTIHNNVIKYPKQKGLAIGGGDFENLSIFNNVLYGMNPNIGSYRPLVSLSGNHHNLRFHNNIIYGTVPANLFMVRGLYFDGNTSGVAGMDHNLYYQQDPDQPITYVNENYTMSEWSEYLSETGWDLHSPQPQAPLFVDPINDDFRLQPGSPAIDAGIDVGLPFEGQAPDIGAYETSAN